MKEILTTERLLIRQFGPDDWPEVFAMNSSAAVMHSIASGRIRPLEEEKASFARILANYQKGDGLGVWAVLLREGSQFIGAGSMTALEDTGEIQLGYRFKEQYWGQGYATEVAKALVDYGFRQLGLTRIVATANLTNEASKRVLEKTGLRWEKRAYFYDWDVNYYSIETNEFFNEAI